VKIDLDDHPVVRPQSRKERALFRGRFRLARLPVFCAGGLLLLPAGGRGRVALCSRQAAHAPDLFQDLLLLVRCEALEQLEHAARRGWGGLPEDAGNRYQKQHGGKEQAGQQPQRASYHSHQMPFQQWTEASHAVSR
jgi:hypothetical protein